MERLNFPYSLKNIPVPGKDSYLKILLGKTSAFIERIRWKTFFFLNPEVNEEISETFGLKTARTAPRSKELNDFENDLCGLVTNVSFNNKHTKPFQRELKRSIKSINESEKIFLLADKTTNVYKIDAEKYQKLLLDNVTKVVRTTNKHQLMTSAR